MCDFLIILKLFFSKIEQGQLVNYGPAMSRDKPAFKNAKFLIYTKFESKMPPKLSESTIAGSLLIDSALTEEEAKEKISVYEERSDNCAISRGHSSYVCIANRPEWWQ